MTKISLRMKSKSWMLLSPLTTMGSYSENELLMPLSPICKNYSKIIINNGPRSATAANVKENTGYKAMLQSTFKAYKKCIVFEFCGQ